ncbi:hypothetical protein LVY72_20180 [Arthrobacter sp. I2-34]|uniref:Mucin-associated surface protein n=1 Tax=Arthrobacter hankyongi TaxID=2904801 RepID=A0ABS9LC09_9MICC|nr:hypothetical protein [Arthrobacter hankyongi]MCG2624211.1 hypothetical protein [Arthrobacter hankyongi]
MTRPGGQRAAAAMLMLGLLTACSVPQPELADSAAAALQSRAAAIRTAAAGGDYRAALKALDGLAEELDRAAGQGEVSFPRYQSIDTAVDRLRADLNASLQAASPSPVASPVPAAPVVPATQNPPVAPVQPAMPAPAEPKSKEGKAEKADRKSKAGQQGNNGRGKAAKPGRGKGKSGAKQHRR